MRWNDFKIDLRFQFQGCDLAKESPTNVGRPRLSYDEGSSRLKSKIAAKVSTENDNNSNLLIHAATVA